MITALLSATLGCNGASREDSVVTLAESAEDGGGGDSHEPVLESSAANDSSDDTGTGSEQGCSDVGPTDTGCYVLYLTGTIAVGGSGELESAEVHYNAVNERCGGGSVCLSGGNLAEAGTAPANCPECIWSFAMAFDTQSTEGRCCDALQVVNMWGDEEEVTLGFSDYYLWTSAGYVTYRLDDVIWRYQPPDGWRIIAYNYGSFKYDVSVTAGEVRFASAVPFPFTDQ